jgi:hypothetical protein
MSEEKKIQYRGQDRRKGERRKTHIDPKDLPFPDRRSGLDRRQMDRRVVSDEEKEELLKRITDRAATGAEQSDKTTKP